MIQFFPTEVCNVTAWRHSRLRAHWLMALVGGGAEGEVCILCSPGIAASPISLLSMGGVCGRRLMAGKILFTGRQTCSLYLVLWLCEFKSIEDCEMIVFFFYLLMSAKWIKTLMGCTQSGLYSISLLPLFVIVCKIGTQQIENKYYRFFPRKIRILNPYRKEIFFYIVIRKCLVKLP